MNGFRHLFIILIIFIGLTAHNVYVLPNYPPQLLRQTAFRCTASHRIITWRATVLSNIRFMLQIATAHSLQLNSTPACHCQSPRALTGHLCHVTWQVCTASTASTWFFRRLFVLELNSAVHLFLPSTTYKSSRDMMHCSLRRDARLGPFVMRLSCKAPQYFKELLNSSVALHTFYLFCKLKLTSPLPSWAPLSAVAIARLIINITTLLSLERFLSVAFFPHVTQWIAFHFICYPFPLRSCSVLAKGMDWRIKSDPPVELRAIENYIPCHIVASPVPFKLLQFNV